MDNKAFSYYPNLDEVKNSNSNNNQKYLSTYTYTQDDRGFGYNQYNEDALKFPENSGKSRKFTEDSNKIPETPEVKQDGRGFAPYRRSRDYLKEPNGMEPRKEESGDTTGKDKKKRSDGRKPWLIILKEYTSISTIHGLYHIATVQPFLVRRILWLILFLGCAGILVVQVSTNVLYYLSWPMSVDVRINYNDSILFPAVTICNQNAFRSTVAYNASIYTLVSSLFMEAGQNSSNNNNTDFVHGFESDANANMSLEDLYYMAGHSVDDLIVSCEFHGAECTASDFVPILTDFGLCYTFNSPDGNASVRKALATGSEGGLRLHLNIEQYEYMKGPNSGAGLKLQVHNPEEPPLVRDQGIAIPPGSQAFVAIKTIEISNLGKPHGKCNDTLKLDFYSQYTMTTCKINCKQRYVLERCGCRDIYMSQKSDRKISGSTVCTLEEYADCLKPALDDFGMLSGDECDCPVPCYRLAYEPSVSYATASNYDIDSLLGNTDTVQYISEKYVHARNIQQRVTKSVVRDDTLMIEHLNETVSTIGIVLYKLKEQVESDRVQQVDMFDRFQDRLRFHKREALDNVEYIFQHDFVRGWDVYKERAFNFVTQDFYDIPLQFKRALQNYSALLLPNSTESERRLLTFPLLNLAHSRLDCIDRALEYLNNTRNAFYTGEPLLTYRTTMDRHYDMSYITLPIIQTGIEWEPDQYDNLLLSFQWLSDGLNLLIDISNDFSRTGIFNESLYESAEYDVIRGGKRYNYRLFMYENRVVVVPLDKIQQIIEHFNLLNRTLTNVHEEFVRKSVELESFVDDFTNTHFRLLAEFDDLSATYLSNLSYSKTSLGDFASREEMKELPGFMNLFFAVLRDLLYALQQQLIQLDLAYQDLWRSIVEEEITGKFYEHVYNDSFTFLNPNISDPTEDAYIWKLFASMLNMDESETRLYAKQEIIRRMNGDFHAMNIDEKLMNIHELFMNLTGHYEAARILRHDDNHLRIAFEELTTALNMFREKNRVDSSFYRENFMRLDVYMQELSYEVVSQQASYDSAQLLSDIGGSVGLFIGGSVLSLFELIDVFVHNGLRRLLNR